MSQAYMHPQHESRLLSVPIEIRRAIYANAVPRQIHVFLSQGKLRLSACLEPNLGDHRHDGRERGRDHVVGSNVRDPEAEARWARRLRSSWGPHWQCEELTLSDEGAPSHNSRRHGISNLLFSCKKLFTDVLDIVAERTAFNVTDTVTMNVLLSKSDDPGSSSDCPWSFCDHVVPNIRRLNITFRLPVAFYEDLEYGIGSALSRDRPADNLELTSHSRWAYVWSTIHRLQQLRSLYIWLDHDGRRSWSVVKERLALHHLIAGLTAQKQFRQAKELPPTEISVNLPKLHPGISGPLTHFVGDGLQLPFTIERRYRQRFHCRQDASGRLAVEYEADFPILYEISELQEASGDLAGDIITLEEIEDLEERMWERGENVNGVMNELYGMCIHWGNM
ncbi:hypothetical protein F5X98DRAFT_347035 [Xylaria grammica]|nr:hypothetical protein F5X98DRAFT_347035 [Xylaria grammica]